MNNLSPDLLRHNRRDPAERLRDQAAACRRLASVARSVAAGVSLIGVAFQFEADATLLDAAGRS